MKKKMITVLVIFSFFMLGSSFPNAEDNDHRLKASKQENRSTEESLRDIVTPDYVVVDTGQILCYDDSGEISCPGVGEAFYGQDAQYDGNQPSYTLSGDGLTVYDHVTGLTWVRDADLDGDGDIDVDDKRTFSEAQAYPATLNAQNFGGYNDWRVPTIKELYSLIDFRGTDPMSDNPTGLVPFIDTTYFEFAYGDTSAGERIIDSQWVTSTLYVANSNQMFGVNFADGRIKGYGLTGGPGGEKTFYVRLCRGNTGYGTNSFVDHGDGTITDSATGLMWSQDDSGDGSTGPRSGMIWEDALAWVQQKNDENYLGYNDWRLPHAKEMQSIVDYTRAPDATGSAAIDPLFNISQITNEDGDADYPWFWTGTTHVRQDGSGEAGIYVCFGRGLGYMFGSWVDIHGAGCQRSDRKDGDFTGYTYVPDGYYFGMAPQGDAARMYNYVRCVRDVPSNIFSCTAECLTPVVLPGEQVQFHLTVENLTDQFQSADVATDIYLCNDFFFKEDLHYGYVPFSAYQLREADRNLNVPSSVPPVVKNCDLKYELIVSDRMSGEVLCSSSCTFQIQD